jgi:hypothetical protein
MGGPTLIPPRVDKVAKGRSVIGGACFATDLVVGDNYSIILEVIGQLLHNRWSWSVIREGGHVLIRHGNTFQLANKAILDACMLTGRKPSQYMSRAHAGLRETIVNISFIAPTPSANNASSIQRRAWVCFCVILFEISVGIITTVVTAFNDMIMGTLLA